MEINYYQIGILIIQCVLISGLILLLFRIRSIMGISLLYTTLGLFQYMQVFLASTVYIEIAKGIIVSPGSSVLFAGSLFAVLLVYIKEDAIETRKIIYALLIANIIMSLLLFLFGWHFHQSNIYNPLNVSIKFFDYNAWILFVGTITLFIDAILIIILYEFISKFVSNFLLRIYLTMFLVLSFDTICFSIFAFWNFNNLKSIIISGLIAKNSSVVFYGFIFYIYLKYIDKGNNLNHANFKDIFYALSYKQKYEIVQNEKEIERQNAEKKIKQSIIKYETLANIAPVGIFLTKPDGYTIYVNPKWTTISGLSHEDALGYGWLNAVHPNDRIQTENGWALATNKKASSYAEYRFLHSNGEIKWVLGQAVPEIDADNQIIGYVGTITDITEIKNYEQQLKKAKEQTEESEAFLENIFENIPNMIFIKDATDLRFVRFNRAGEQLLGYKSIDLIGKNDYDFFPQEQAEFFTSTDRKIFETDGYVIIEEERINTKNGTKILYTKKIAIKDKNGNNKYLLGISEDITQKKEIEKELIAAKEKAEESDRLKTSFLHNLSHEIRTPMNAIIGFSGFLKDEELSDEKRNYFITIIQNSCHQLLSIVTDILTISSIETKQEKINTVKVNINNILIELLSIFNQQASKQNISISIKCGLNEQQSEIYTDKTKITQILINLISNALKFTSKGFVEFGYKLITNQEPYELEFFVKDTGIGIKPENQEIIFERFRQANREIQMNFGGTGLGLSISKGFVELLGGKIWLCSEPEKGSTFYFTLPYKPVIEMQKFYNQLQKPTSAKTILIAEDDEYNYLYISELLSNFDVKIIRAKDGAEAIELFKSNSEISLILMDIKMPTMTGDEATKIIKSLKLDLPIIAQSAYALEHERTKYNSIFDDYITKPININDLKKKLKKYIEI